MKTRDSNIELLRIVCIVSVITLHFCNATPNAFSYVENGSGVSYFVLRLFYSFSIIAVNTFLVISGYFMIERTSVKVGKAVDLFALVGFYGALGYMASVLIGNEVFSLKSFVWACVPKSYYVYIYLAVYLLSPYINRAVRNITQQQYFRLLLLSTFLFCAWNTAINLLCGVTGREITNMFTTAQKTTDRGFTIVIFVLMYIWGGYIRRYGLFRNQKSVCISVAVGCVLITAVGRFLFTELKALLYYDSIFVVLQSVAVFSLFAQLRIKSAVINGISKATFGVYLIHGMGLSAFQKLLPMEKWLSGGVGMVLLTWLVTVGGVYLLSVLAETVRGRVAHRLNKRWKECRFYNAEID